MKRAPLSLCSARHCLVLAFCLCIGIADAAEPGFDATHREKAESLRHDSLGLNITLPKSSFFLGELIPVTFRFEDKKNTGQYHAWIGTYDRSGRISDLGFAIDGPPGSHCDPLAAYFESGFFMGGGIGNHAKLGSHEQVFHLNEWVRIDRPGKYRLYATSSRVSQTKDNVSHSFPLVSPIVAIEIREPTAEEQDRTFREAVPASVSAHPGADDRAAVYAALSRLRYLDTDASRRHLRSLLGRNDGTNTLAKFGLIGTRAPDAAIALLEEGIANPDVAITAEYFDALEQLRRIRPKGEQNQQKTSAAFPGSKTVPPVSWQTTDHFGDRADWKKLADAFEQKTGHARAVCASSLFGLIKNEQWQDKAEADAKAKGSLYMRQNRERFDCAAVLAKIRGPLAASLLELTDDEQERLLHDCWELIRSPEFLPPLRKIADAQMKWPDRSFHSGLRSLVVLRLADLDPAFGKQIILEDIRRKEPRYSLEVFCSLPMDDLKKELPLLSSRFAAEDLDFETSCKVTGIIDHVADKSIYDDVKRRYLQREGFWACLIQQHCLAYFIKVRRAEGLDLAFRALTFRKKEHTHCYSSVASEVLAPQYGPDVELRMLKVLRAESEPEVITDMTRVFLKHGTEAVIDPLLDVIGRLSPKAINEDYSYSTEAGARRHAVEGLIRAASESVYLSDRVRWKMTPEQKTRLKSSLASEWEKKEFSSQFKAEGSP